MDFLLPKLKLDPTFTETSTTDVKWHDALCESVVFEAWDEFDEIIDQTKKKLELVDERFINSAKLILCANTGESPEPVETSVGSSTQSEPNSSAENVLSLAYIVDFFSGSTSTDGLHDNLCRATGILLHGLQMQKGLRIVNRGYSSHFGMAFDAKGKHLPHNITIKLDRIMASHPEATLKSLPICIFEWKGPGLDFTCVGGNSGEADMSRMHLLLKEVVTSGMQDSQGQSHISFGSVSATVVVPKTKVFTCTEKPQNVVQRCTTLCDNSFNALHESTESPQVETCESTTLRTKQIDEIVNKLIANGSV